LDAEGRCRLVLGAVDRRVGRGVDHRIRAHAFDHARGAARLVQIQRLARAAVRQHAGAGGRHHFAERRQAAPQFMADLAVGAEQQQPHGR